MSIFTVLVPTTSTALLTAAQLRTAAGLGVADTSQDAALADLGLQAASLISSYCNVARDGGLEPSLLSESCQEKFRFMGGWFPGYWGSSYVHQIELQSQPRTLLLARRPIISVDSVSEDGIVVPPLDDQGNPSYEISDKATGFVQRLLFNWPVEWWAMEIIVQYTAGFASPPANLVRAAQKTIQWMLSVDGRDPAVTRTSTEIVGVRMKDQSFGLRADSEPDLPNSVVELLREFRTQAIG